MVKQLSHQIVRRETLKEQVYKYLKNEIIIGELKPGERLIEEKISEQLNVSRSPIREAVRMLEKDGLLNIQQTGGVTVVNPTVEDYRYLFETRVEMESVAAYYAAIRRTDNELKVIKKTIDMMEIEVATGEINEILKTNLNFHEMIVTASHNPFLISMTMQLRGINSFYRKAILENNPKYVKGALEDHKKIFQAIDTGNQEAAKASMRAHIEHDYQSFMKIVSQKGGEQ